MVGEKLIIILKKILIVAESINVEDSSGSKANVALIKNLYKAGFKIQVYHYSRKDIHLPGISCHSIKENRRSFLFLLSRTERYLRYWLNLKLYKPIEQIFGFSFTLLNDRNSIISALKESKIIEPDLILTLSKAASFRPHHALLKLPEWHTKWMAYIHDPYPFASYPRPYDYVESGHQQKRKFFLEVATKAKFVSYPSKLLAEWMESYYPPLKGKAIIIPHQIDDNEESGTEVPKFFEKDAFTILYAGALMDARNPMGLVGGFQKFLKKNPEAGSHSQLLIIGGKSKYFQEFQKVKKELPQFYSSDNYIPFSTVLEMQKNAAINVILEAKGPISPFLPGKFPHCVKAGKPILLLGPFYSESRRLLGEDYLYWAEIDEIDIISEHIENLYFRWRKGPTQLLLNRPDLEAYLSDKNLKAIIESKIN